MADDRPASGGRLSVGLMAIGSEMAGFTVLGVLLDWAAGSMPAFTIGLTLLGVVVAFVHLVRFTKNRFGPAAGQPPGPPDGGPR